MPKQVVQEFKEDFIFISTDDLRQDHPAYEQLQKDPETVQNAANLVNPYASAWTERLIKHCIETQYNLIIDSTLGENIKAVYDTIDMFRNNNYQVHLRVMAVPAIVSKLSIFLRYETQLAKEGFARWTRMEDHDDRFNNLKPNLLEIEKIKKTNSVKFFERVLEISGTSQLRYLEDFEIENLENNEVNNEEIFFIRQMAGRVRNLIMNRGGDMSEFEKLKI